LMLTWETEIADLISKSGLQFNPPASKEEFSGGRKGIHSNHLDSLIKEMTEVFAIDPAAKW